MTKKFYLLLLPIVIGFSLISLQVNAAPRLQKWQNEKPVIVIDPGHGGDNEGTTENNHVEKNMTMITALSMYHELSKYDELDVYLTHTEDKDMSLKQRAKFASDVNADMLISLHYNASVDHNLFGAEAWIPYSFPFNNYSYQLAYEFLKPLKEKGIFIRGIKTKLNDKGTDYYGIIRESTALNIPSVILEHCHVDENRDAVFCASEENLIQFGKDDAHAVLQYLGINANNSIENNLQEVSKESAVLSTYADETSPDICSIEWKSEDIENGILSFVVSAADYDSGLIYYDYSINGGVTFSELNPWPGSDALQGCYEDTFTWNITIPQGSSPSVILRAYNLFDLFTESNLYVSPHVFGKEETTTEENVQSIEAVTIEAETLYTKEQESKETKHEVKFWIFIVLSVFIAFGFILLALTSQIGVYLRRKKRKAGKRRRQQK